MSEAELRPIERRILKMADTGMADAEIAWRFRRSPGFVRKIRTLADVPRSGTRSSTGPDGLRPLERRVLRWREEGVDYPELAARFRRHPHALQRIEALARHKLSVR
jgi:DNA-binding CsgD family transcriptional regulator